MGRWATAVAACLAAAALSSAPAGAVQGGTPDGDAHPYVGMAMFYAHGAPLERCSGTLLSATTFVTAGHCAGFDADTGETPDHAEVWFGAGPIPRGDYPGGGVSCAGYTGYPCKGDVGGTPHAHAGWTGSLTRADSHDIGVVVLDGRGWELDTYAQVAPKGYLDTLATARGKQSVSFAVVGYGVQFERPNFEVAVRERYVGTTQLVDLRSALADGYQVVMSDSGGNGTGGGGICFGDSGGPVFHGEYLVADISSGTKYCSGKSAAYRLDQDSARSFLSSYVRFP
ncbi:MAG: trypsin-like serine protease [Gaiellaceae bacterium]